MNLELWFIIKLIITTTNDQKDFTKGSKSFGGFTKTTETRTWELLVSSLFHKSASLFTPADIQASQQTLIRCQLTSC